MAADLRQRFQVARDNDIVGIETPAQLLLQSRIVFDDEQLLFTLGHSNPLALYGEIERLRFVLVERQNDMEGGAFAGHADDIELAAQFCQCTRGFQNTPMPMLKQIWSFRRA
ncbi:hypothetical protein LP420_19290 [Massilia sp. B-10]|nr:hypothetical protein LP420_19290 [Massilia sp. B-10]